MKSKYVMETAKESERLEYQAKIKNYSINEELKYLELKDVKSVIDLGCGTGLVSRNLQRRKPQLKIDACDFSEIRLQQAKKLSHDINYFQADIEKLETKNEYDLIISRYAFEHLNSPQSALNSAYKICKKSGKIYIIDFDGIFLNMFTCDDNFNHDLNKIQKHISFDLYIGRKLPTMLSKAGFSNIKWHAQINTFKGIELQEEAENCKQRCHNAMPMLTKALGCKEAAIKFSQKYITYLQREETVIFYNKFIVMADKT